MSETKKKIDITTKLEAIEKLNRGVSLNEIATEHGVGLSTAFSWMYGQKQIMELSLKPPKKKAYRSKTYTSCPTSSPVHDSLDGKLLRWYEAALERRPSRYITSKVLRREAKRISFELTGVKNYGVSISWVKRWRRRHGIVSKYANRKSGVTTRSSKPADAPRNADIKECDEPVVISDDSKQSSDGFDTLLYDDIIIEHTKPMMNFQAGVSIYPELAVESAQGTQLSGSPNFLTEELPDDISPNCLPSSSPTELSNSYPPMEYNYPTVFPDGNGNHQENEESSVNFSDPWTENQEGRRDLEEDQAFLDSLLPKMQQLNPPDKAMLKDQILQLIECISQTQYEVRVVQVPFASKVQEGSSILRNILVPNKD